MENQLMVFGNEEFGKIRIIIKNEEPWFVAKDVSQILGYEKLDSMYKRIDKDDICKIDPQSEEYQGLRQNGETLESNKNIRILAAINESGLYEAIFGSILPQAKKFKKWVTSEVLPSIRKHGTYMTSDVIEKTLSNPDFIIKLATELKDERQKRIDAEKQLEEQKPKIDMFNEFLNVNQGIDMDEAANVLKEPDLGRNKLYNWLKNQKILMKGVRNNIPYSQFSKHFEVIEVVNQGGTFSKCLVKPSGISFIRKRLNKEKRLASTSQ